jgi:hypothetical protein
MMRLVPTIALGMCLAAACVARAGAADAIPSGSAGGLALGGNWGPYETYKGVSFRWVANDAEIVLQSGSGEAQVSIVCQGGPSLGEVTFPLRVLDASHRQVDHAVCAGPGQPQTLLLPLARGGARYLLHVDGGGRRVPGEQRVLNFQVFALNTTGGALGGGDVVDPRNGVHIGLHWYPIEHYKGLTFRWMDGQDGQLIVSSDHTLLTTMRLVLEIGPSVGARRTALVVHDAHGAVVLRTTLTGRQVVLAPVDLRAGENSFSLAVASASRPVPHDPRILNVRLLSAAVLR